jgi:ABC-type transport system involved in multi-copper enzyme maturation permease subunit
MYLWKCWCDTRVRFAVTLILVAAFTVLMVTFTWNYAAGSSSSHGVTGKGLGLFSLPVRGADSLTVSMFWSNWIGLLLSSGFYIAVVAWIWGSSAVGEEFARNTEEFLLTRPRRRRRFVWLSWLHGAGQLLAAVFSYVGTVFLALLFLTKVLRTWKLLGLVLPLFVLGIVVHGVVFLLTTLSRGRRDGSTLALAVLLFYPLIVILARSYWAVPLPSPGDFLEPFTALARGLPVQLPVFSMIGWTLFALACPFLAQWYVERSEVGVQRA